MRQWDELVAMQHEMEIAARAAWTIVATTAILDIKEKVSMAIAYEEYEPLRRDLQMGFKLSYHCLNLN